MKLRLIIINFTQKNQKTINIIKKIKKLLLNYNDNNF